MTGQSHAGRTLRGPCGEAIEVLITAHDVPDTTATLATWLLDVPGQSPAWTYYVISVIHLRPIPGVRPADIRVPGATHELLLIALDPAGGHDPADCSDWRYLTPVNAVEQLELPNDSSAVELAELAAKAVLAGVLPAEPPLAGQREPWRSALIKTAAHLRGEAHAGPDGSIVVPEPGA